MENLMADQLAMSVNSLVDQIGGPIELDTIRVFAKAIGPHETGVFTQGEEDFLVFTFADGSEVMYSLDAN